MTDDYGSNQRLVDWIHTQLPGAEDVRIEGLDRITAGHSAEMLTLTIVMSRGGREERQDVVLRLRPHPPALLEPYDLKRQFDVLQALESTPVRTPRALWLEDSGEVLGRPFFMMEKVPGSVYEMETPAGADGTRDNIVRMCEGMAEQLAAIHSVDLDAVGLDRFGSGTDHLERELNHWADEMHRVQRAELPALERLLQVLRDTKPESSSRITLIHGDAKPGNFAFVDGEVSAVFDWEMADIGDPLTDIGWMEMLWMQPVGITCHADALTIEEFLEHYQRHSGITPQNRPWYRAFNAFKMAVISLIGAMLFDSGASDDTKLIVMASGVSLLTDIGLAQLGIQEQLDAGPVDIRQERIQQVQGQVSVAH